MNKTITDIKKEILDLTKILIEGDDSNKEVVMKRLNNACKEYQKGKQNENSTRD